MFQFIVAALALAGIVLVTKWLLPRALAGWQARRERHLVSEAHAFRQLEAAIRQGPIPNIDDQMMAWLNRLDRDVSLRDVVRQVGPVDLLATWSKLTRDRYGPDADFNRTATADDRAKLVSALRRCRTDYLSLQVDQMKHQGLPALNPPPP